MNKFRILLPFLLLGTGNVFAQAKDSSRYNFGIEQWNNQGQPQGWSFTFDNGSNEGYISRPDSTEVQEGKYSIYIGAREKQTTRRFGVCVYYIPANFEGKTIKLTGYLKTKDITGGNAGLWMRIDGSDGSMLGFDNMDGRGPSGTTDWTAYTIEYPYDCKKAGTIVIGALLTGTGELWMDNLQLTIDGKPLAEVPALQPVVYAADKDSVFNHGSGIAAIALNKSKIKQLTSLGMLWGFVKYYHPAIARGEFNMDAELFRLLPKIAAAQTDAGAFDVMEAWVDKLGTVPACKPCAQLPQGNVKVRSDYGNLFAPGYLPESLRHKLAFIRDNRDTVKEHYYIDIPGAVSFPRFQHEQAYPGAYPDAGTRLLALYRYWTMIQYFFPDRHLITGDWNSVLAANIPAFLQAENEEAYTLTCLKLIATIGDTHANILRNEVLERIKGKNAVPLKAVFVEDKLVVTDYYITDTVLRQMIRPGTIIEAVNGVSIPALMKKYLPLTSSSNYETQLRDLVSLNGFIMRTDKEKIKMTFSGGSMVHKEVELATIPLDKARRPITWEINTGSKAYTVLDHNIGYIYPAKLKEGDIDSIKKDLQHTRGLIMDLRCYPSVYMPYTFGSWLKATASPFVRHTRGTMTWPGTFVYDDHANENGGPNPDAYKGKMVILVNASTQSRAEYTTMALSSTEGAIVLGSTTAGADGNVADITLPGNIRTWISGIGVLYPDGTESQRAGVKIDRKMKPTIEGIRKGKDELLEEAINIINH